MIENLLTSLYSYFSYHLTLSQIDSITEHANAMRRLVAVQVILIVIFNHFLEIKIEEPNYVKSGKIR